MSSLLRRVVPAVALAAAALAFTAPALPPGRAAGVAWVQEAAAEPEFVPRTGKFVVPPMSGPVTDLANALSPAERADLADRLRRYRAQAGPQIAVLIVPSLAGEPVEDVAFAVARSWKLGDEKRDDGVLLLWSVEDRKLRIEAGRGAEGDLPDATAGMIIDQRIAPRFKEGRYALGLAAGVDGIIEAFGAAPAGVRARPPQAPPRPAAPEITPPKLFTVAAIGVLFVLVAIWRIRAVGVFGFLSELFFFLSVLGRSGGGGGGGRRRDDDYRGGGGGFGGGGASGDY